MSPTLPLLFFPRIGAGRPAPPTLSGHIRIPAKVQQYDSSGLLSLAPLDPTEDLSAPSQDGDVEKQGHTQKGNERLSYYSSGKPGEGFLLHFISSSLAEQSLIQAPVLNVSSKS